MLPLSGNVKIYYSRTPVNLRKSFDGLAGAVQQYLRADPLSGHLFVFFNRTFKLVKEFFDLCGEQLENEVPASPLHNALNYALKLKEQLSLFLKNPKLNIDNNPAENVIRPIALGRKNWLFAGPAAGIWR